MSQSHDNIVTKGLSGTVYDLVFRQWFGRTIAAKKARKSARLNAIQLNIQDNFKAAARYAKAAVTDAALKLAYKAKAKPGQSAYNMAMVDFFKPPTIGEIDTSAYTGQANSSINIEAFDDFKVKSVAVKIERSNGELVEQGDASLSSDGLHWLYNVSTTGTTVGYVITVTATDLPGHSITKQKSV